MAVYIPDSDIYFCNVDLDSDYSDTRGFTTKTEQQTWFLNKVGLTCSDYNYQKKDERIYVNKNIRIVDNYNYVFWINHDDEATYVYAFITDLEYINRNTTAITFRIDVFQSFIFDSDFHQCAIERIIPAVDTPGKYFLNENVIYGPNFRIPQKINIFSSGVGVALVVSETDKNHTGDWVNSINMYCGSPCSYTLIVSKGIDSVTSIDPFLNEWLYYMVNRPNSIINVIYLPIDAIPDPYKPSIDNPVVYLDINTAFVVETKSYRFNFPEVTDFIGYTPINNKMLCYPYSYLEFVSPDGQTLEFKRQNSLNSYISFKVSYELSATPRVFITPSSNYMYTSDSDDFIDNTIVYTLSQPISQLKDYYFSYLQQNANRLQLKDLSLKIGLVTGGMNMAMGLISGASSVALGFASGGASMAASSISGANSAMSGVEKFSSSVLSIANFMAEQEDLMNYSPSTYVPTASIMEYDYYFTMNIVVCAEEVAKNIDKYFSMYGYKMKIFDVPTWNNRTYWDYIKTYGCSIKGNYAQQFARELESVFNNGIRIWHTDDIGNYELDNA